MRLSTTDSSGGGGGGGFDPTANIAFSGNNTHTGTENFSNLVSLLGKVQFGIQTFTLNGGVQSVSSSNTAGCVVFLSGNTAGSTISLPTASVAGQMLMFNTTSNVQWTLNAGGPGTIDGNSSLTIPASVAFSGWGLIADGGTNWRSMTPTEWFLVSFGAGLWGRLASQNTWTQPNIFSNNAALNNGLSLANQPFTATGNISDSAGTVVTFSGAMTAQVLSLPGFTTVGRLYFLRNEATAAHTVSGNGTNIDSGGSISLSPGNAGPIWYDGTQWWTIGFAPWLTTTIGANITFGSTSTVTFNSGLVPLAQVRPGRQAASTTPFAVSNTGGMYIACSLSPTGVQTVNLPASPTANMIFIIKDEGLMAGTNAITVSGNGKLIDGAANAMITTNGGALRLEFNGTNWFSW